MDNNIDEFKKERDLIVAEIGEFSAEDFEKSGITMEEYNNPTEETIRKLIDYVSTEYKQTAIYSE